MSPTPNPIQQQTRRHFFSDCALGVGKIALASLLTQANRLSAMPPVTNPMAVRAPHFTARAKNVIYMFMAGGPSQLELFDYKPELERLNGEPIPQSFLEGRRFAFMNSFTNRVPQLLYGGRQFRRHGQSGAWVSELLPHMASIADELAFVKTVKTEVFNHGPAKLFMNTGSAQFGRPSMGAWVTYGIGSESTDLPGFVVLQSGPRGPRGGSPLWGSGFLPTVYQGVPFRTTGEPVLNLSTPQGLSQQQQGQALNVIRDLNTARLEQTGDAEIATRISAY